MATDHLEIPHLQTLGHARLLARAGRQDLRFDHRRGRGAVFHMLSSVEPLATVGVTAIAESFQRADELYDHVRAVLDDSRDKHVLPARRPIHPALDTAG